MSAQAVTTESVGLMLGPDTAIMRPPQPRNLKESGISYRLVESLILKTIKQEGAMSLEMLSESMKLPIGVFKDITISLNHRGVLDTPIPQHYDLTNKGRELVHHYENEDAYVGPAPVSFEAYRRTVLQQAQREKRITQEDMDEVFQEYPMRPELRRILKEGFNSQRVIIFWGPPGNGKSLVTDNLHRLLKDPVLLPYAFEFNNRVVQYYDPAYHHLMTDLMQREEEATANAIGTSGKPDRRWLISRPPLVTVGTEFRVEHFQIAFDGKFDAPPHVKANNGIFIFDDLGRQTQDHNMILNQFIYPLEQQETIVKFAGGSSMRLPYKQRLFLSTNLNFHHIIDDAFSRRLLFQVLVDRPTDALWKQIVVNIAQKYDITEDFARILARKLIAWFKRDGRAIRAVDPRNIFIMLDATLEDGEKLKDKLTFDLFERIYHQYPPAYEKDAVGYLVYQKASEEEFKDAFMRTARSHDVDELLALRLADQLYDWFQRDNRMPRTVDPSNLFTMLEGMLEEGETIADKLTEELFEEAYQQYAPYYEQYALTAGNRVGLGSS
jgi:SpoVK/Ycf46/Vps4 family AAA+-type ATPase/predicted transcriptional regulator